MNWLVYDSQEGYATVIKMEAQKEKIQVVGGSGETEMVAEEVL